MSDTDQATQTTEPERITKRDLAERGIDALPKATGDIAVSRIAGGVSFATATEVMSFAKLMAVSGKMVRSWLRNNPGSCLGICFQAIEWGISPFQAAQKAYEVNDMVAYESQLIHAVVEARAPLKHRLDCRYDGEGESRSCTVIGAFRDGTFREYTTPTLAEIKKHLPRKRDGSGPGGSPLWYSDPDQQLFYRAMMMWSRKWVPDVVLGIYSRDELEDSEALPYESGVVPRLTASGVSRDEGYSPGFAESELEQIAPGKKAVIVEEAPQPAKEARPRAKKGKPSRTPAKAEIKPAKPAKAEQPKSAKIEAAKSSTEAHGLVPVNVPGYIAHFNEWLAKIETVKELKEKWVAERPLRNRCNLTAEERYPLEVLVGKKLKELE